MDWRLDAILEQNVSHGIRRSDECLNVVALRTRKCTGQRFPNASRHHGDVMMKILFKESVIGRDTRDLQLTRKANTGVVRDERCMDVDEVDVSRFKRIKYLQQRAPPHASVFRISGNPRGGDSNYGSVFFNLCARVARRHQSRVYIAVGKILTECPDGGGYAVNARKVDV